MDICVGCGQCPVSGGPYVGSRGPIEASIAIVGEAPGEQELRAGKPFIGPSGQLLEATLRKAGLEPDEALYITNALQCRPKEAPPPNSSLKACQARLYSELSQGNFKVILALGNSAMRSLLGDYNLKITQERGRMLDSSLGVVLPTYHPAAVLRNPQYYTHMLHDFRTAVEYVYQGTRRDPGQTQYTIVKPETLTRALQGLMKQTRLVCDIETTGLDPLRDEILCVGIAWAKNKVLVLTPDLLEWEATKIFFQDYQGYWTWHNGKFDIKFLNQVGLEPRLDHDTMLMHYALDETKGTHDLKQLSQVYLGADHYAEELKPYLKTKATSFAKVPKPVLYKYMARDCDYTYQLHEVLSQEINKEHNRGLTGLYATLLMPAANFLLKVEQKGIYVNQDTLEKVGAELEINMEESVLRLNELAEGSWDPDLYCEQTGSKSYPEFMNPASPQQMAWMLFRQFRLRPRRGYLMNTQEATLLNLTSEHPFVDELLNYRGLAKQYNTYVKGIKAALGPDGRVHTTYNIHGTVTGRLSSSNPNMQNIPRESTIRNIFEAAPRFRFVEMDYSQAELRVLAELSQDDFLMKCYLEGRDLHHEMAITFYGEGYTKDQRVRAKAVNFGIAYGRGPDSIAKEHKIPYSEAVGVVRSWYKRAPQAGAFINKCRQAPVLRRTLVTPFGRRRRFNLSTRDNLYALQNEASNFPIQSVASDLTLHSAIQIQELFNQQYYGRAHVVNIVHDSILAEIHDTINPEEVAHLMVTVSERMPQILLDAKVPFKADVKVGTVWGSL